MLLTKESLSQNMDAMKRKFEVSNYPLKLVSVVILTLLVQCSIITFEVAASL